MHITFGWCKSSNHSSIHWIVSMKPPFDMTRSHSPIWSHIRVLISCSVINEWVTIYMCLRICDDCLFVSAQYPICMMYLLVLAHIAIKRLCVFVRDLRHGRLSQLLALKKFGSTHSNLHSRRFSTIVIRHSWTLLITSTYMK